MHHVRSDRELRADLGIGYTVSFAIKKLAAGEALSGGSSFQPYQCDNSAPEERGGGTGIGHGSRKRERRIEGRRRVAAHDVGSDSRPVWVKICIADPGLKIGKERSTGNDGPL